MKEPIAQPYSIDVLAFIQQEAYLTTPLPALLYVKPTISFMDEKQSSIVLFYMSL